MGTSLESSRPIMAPSLTSTRAPTPSTTKHLSTSPSHKNPTARYSTYSTTAPSLTPTHHTSLTTDSAHQEIKDIEANLEKLENKKLASQRFVLGPQKTEDLSKLALGAKLERALGRRLEGQDAVMRGRKGDRNGELEEKEKEKVEVS